MARIVILGGAGVFGRRAAARLARRGEHTLIIAGRNAAACWETVRRLQAVSGAAMTAAQLDALTLTGQALRDLGTDILINTVGPFQERDYRVAGAAISARAHYIDLADARRFVNGVTVLDEEAKAAGVLVTSGASSVPALAAAVIDDLTSVVPEPECLDYGISSGNHFDPGPATTASVIGAIGKPFNSLRDGHMQREFGWQPLDRIKIPGLGTRWFGRCDVPDLDLFPARYPSLKSQRFMAGVEVKAFHGGIYLLACGVRAGFIRHPERLTPTLLSVKRALRRLGSDRSGMFVRLTGRDGSGGTRRVRWSLIAGSGHGPFVPATPAVLVARGLAEGRILARGSMPCLGLFTRDEFTSEVADLDIRQIIQ